MQQRCYESAGDADDAAGDGNAERSPSVART